MKYEYPKCTQTLFYHDHPDEPYQCNREMKAFREVEDPNRPGAWVFQCKFCGAFRVIEKERLSRYLDRR